MQTIETNETTVQTETTIYGPAESEAAAKRIEAQTVAAAETAAKPKRAKSSNGKAAAKRVATKTVAPVKPAKPTSEAREAAQRDQADARRLARDVAATAVAAFYSGSSKPFKAASDRFADINTSNGKAATARQAGLALALITYGAGNMRSDGTFVRGGFIVPARVLNPNAKPSETVRAQPESGCLGNMLGRACDFVSGPTSGREQSAAVYRLRLETVFAEIQASLGDKAASAARKLLASYSAKAA